MWDIGCDHGLLGLSFVDREDIVSVNLVDPSEKVIDVLKNKLKDSYITRRVKINVLKEKGQNLTVGKEKKIIFIAGMGGKEMSFIIQNLTPQLTYQDLLVLSPHRNILELRKQLHESGLGLLKELTIKEDGQFYQILCLSKSLEYPPPSLYGEEVWMGETGTEYRHHILKSFSGHKDTNSKGLVSYLRNISI